MNDNAALSKLNTSAFVVAIVSLSCGGSIPCPEPTPHPPAAVAHPPVGYDLSAWEPSQRAGLGSTAQNGPVAVTYNPTTHSLRVLADCRVLGPSYKFFLYPSRSSRSAVTESELAAEFPFGVASVWMEVRRGRAVRTDYFMLGLYQLPVGYSYLRSDLGESCLGATHVVSAMFVGAFSRVSGSVSEVSSLVSAFGVGARANGATVLGADDWNGDLKSCEAAVARSPIGASEAPPTCRSPLVVQLSRISNEAKRECSSDNILVDPLNCGACGVSCGERGVCKGGLCESCVWAMAGQAAHLNDQWACPNMPVGPKQAVWTDLRVAASSPPIDGSLMDIEVSDAQSVGPPSKLKLVHSDLGGPAMVTVSRNLPLNLEKGTAIVNVASANCSTGRANTNCWMAGEVKIGPR